MNPSGNVRLDKWLWAVRLYKTRTQAATACRAGRVAVGGAVAKPSREIHVNDLILVTNEGITRTLKVLGLLEQRVGAKVVREFAEDLTPPSEFEKRRPVVLQPLFYRPKGMGRPTKRDRRLMGKESENL